MTARTLGIVVAGASISAVLFSACSLGDVDFANKACPCGTGYECDAARNVCVLQSEPTDAGPGAPDAHDATTADTGPGCTGEMCPCSGDVDCKERDRSHCSPNKTCVECVAGNDCGAGTYCNSSNQCVLGCKQESDCQISPAAPHCDLVRHQCVVCRTKVDCTNGQVCSPSGQCVDECNPDAGVGCAPPKQCCQGLCIDTTKDPLNCGGCGVACSTVNGTPTCSVSACSWACASGYGHCTTMNSGCETNLRTDAAHCGSCTTDCATVVVQANGISCNTGVCTYTTCMANYDDCDAVRANGCECTCGTKKGERCCPGNVCNAPLMCLTGPKKCN